MRVEKYPCDFYCPACGSDVRVNVSVVPRMAPGSGDLGCPLCKTRFRVVIEFHAIEGGEE